MFPPSRDVLLAVTSRNGALFITESDDYVHYIQLQRHPHLSNIE